MFVTDVEIEVTVELVLAKARHTRLGYLSRYSRTCARGASQARRWNRKRAARESCVQDVHCHWTNARLRKTEGRCERGSRAVVILQTGGNRGERQTVRQRKSVGFASSLIRGEKECSIPNDSSAERSAELITRQNWSL